MVRSDNLGTEVSLANENDMNNPLVNPNYPLLRSALWVSKTVQEMPCEAGEHMRSNGSIGCELSTTP
jgi:hypothetical protein